MSRHHGGGSGDEVKVCRLGTAAECAASRGGVVIVRARWTYPFGGHGHSEQLGRQSSEVVLRADFGNRYELVALLEVLVR